MVVAHGRLNAHQRVDPYTQSSNLNLAKGSNEDMPAGRQLSLARTYKGASLPTLSGFKNTIGVRSLNKMGVEARQGICLLNPY